MVQVAQLSSRRLDLGTDSISCSPVWPTQWHPPHRCTWPQSWSVLLWWNGPSIRIINYQVAMHSSNLSNQKYDPSDKPIRKRMHQRCRNGYQFTSYPACTLPRRKAHHLGCLHYPLLVKGLRYTSQHSEMSCPSGMIGTWEFAIAL